MKLHSIVDVITNSSSEIYVCAAPGAAEEMKRILADILKIAGNNKTVEDLFEIKEEVDPSWIAVLDDCKDYFDREVEMLKERGKLEEDYDLEQAKKDGHIPGCWDYISHIKLTVIPKNGNDDLVKRLLDLFQIEDVSYHTLTPE